MSRDADPPTTTARPVIKAGDAGDAGNAGDAAGGSRRVGARYPDLRAFYADPRRRFSRESDYGVHWRVGGMPGEPRKRVAWVRDTGEVYVVDDDRGGRDVEVVAVIDEEGAVEARLAGWAEACPQPGSLGWLRDAVQDAAQNAAEAGVGDAERGRGAPRDPGDLEAAGAWSGVPNRPRNTHGAGGPAGVAPTGSAGRGDGADPVMRMLGTPPGDPGDPGARAAYDRLAADVNGYRRRYGITDARLVLGAPADPAAEPDRAAAREALVERLRTRAEERAPELGEVSPRWTAPPHEPHPPAPRASTRRPPSVDL